MTSGCLITPTLHIEVRMVTGLRPSVEKVERLRTAVSAFVQASYISVSIGQEIVGFGPDEYVEEITVADYTGPENETATYRVGCLHLDSHAYVLRDDLPRSHRRRHISVPDHDIDLQARVLEIPNIRLKDDWDALVYDESLPSRMLRYLCRMLLITGQPGLNLRIFNWNRLCLLHGSPGSGKSTLCRALSQKLAIRLASVYATSYMVEVDTNCLSSKFYGESGKLISSLFSKIQGLARSANTLVCVVIDEVETIASSRDQALSTGECNDGIRATNQLLTALDQIRACPNVLILCTSNFTTSVDSAFIDRVDLLQAIPPPSAAAIYGIIRSCLNELAAIDLIDVAPQSEPHVTPDASLQPSESSGSRRKKADRGRLIDARPADGNANDVADGGYITPFTKMLVRLAKEPTTPASRVWALAQRCEGMSGRSIRRLPLLGLAMHTWGARCDLHDALTAIEAAVSESPTVPSAL